MRSITMDELRALLENGKKIELVAVREDEEVALALLKLLPKVK